MNFLTPERRRWVILVLVFLAVVVSYIDRQIVSVLKPTLKAAFAMDDRGFALLVNVFVLCYAGAYPVAGWLVDRFGAGRIMLIGVIGWSIACMSTAFA
jgi:ACS family hexuronate transporter-like MFS transporter